MQKEWQGYIEDILNAKKSYVDTSKKVLYKDKILIEKSVRNEDQVVTWVEKKNGEIVDVTRTFK